jgi:hypothetical protein
LLVHVETEDIGTGVVPDNVEVVLAAGDIAPVELGDLDQLAFVRLGQDISQGTDDARPAPNENRRWVVTLEKPVAARDIPALLSTFGAPERKAA